MIGHLIIVIVLIGVSSAQYRIVATAQGPVKGYKLDDGDYYSFYGIPYASAPKGRDKFKGPRPPSMRSDVFEATNNQSVCPQPTPSTHFSSQKDLVITEDCLNLNIFVPITKDEELLPVMVYIHGGGYTVGSGNMIRYQYLMQHGIIIINFNYRLAALGFLCLGTEDIPGNAGSKDQVAALKWVKENIAKFGGNPQKITLAGFSAGAAAAELLMLSDRTKGLFQKVIAESGSTLAPWSMQRDPLNLARTTAAKLGFKETLNISALEEFYINVEPQELIALDYSANTDSSIGFVPCIEPKSRYSFLSDSPVTIIESGKYDKVPYITGFSNMEGIFRLHLFEEWRTGMNVDFSKFLPNDLIFNDAIERNGVIAKIKRLYFEDKNVNEETIQGYIDYFTDILFGYPSIRSARSHAKTSEEHVFMYYFSYVGELSPPRAIHSHVVGAEHIGQCYYLHDFSTLLNLNASSKDLLMRERMTTMWANFVKHGTPIPEKSSLLPVSWPEMEVRGTPHLSIDWELEARDVILPERVQLWDEIYEKHYRKPSPPADILPQ